MSSSTASSTIHQNVVPSEVGWQFVPQYYTFVNKQPNRLHCFYTKSSTFVHGTEGEESKPCYGQHEIHEKITSIGFQDCKVFIHSVDAQASANGGIIIQVIGEMSNRGESWRKFVQTFFLAEQPNGYFVLNDIFRFLKEESVEADDAEDFAEPDVVVAESEPAPEPPQTVTPAREPTPPPVVPPVVPPAAAPSPVPSFTAPVEEPPATDVPEPAPQPPAPVPQPTPAAQPNGHTVVPEPDKSVPVAVAEKSPALTPAPTPVPTTTSVAPAPPAATAPLAQPASTAPRSWASLAASNPKKWGSAVAQESRGLTETPVSPTPSSGTKMPPTTTPSAPRGPFNRHEPITTPAIFIKGVVDPLTPSNLRSVLSQYGPIHHFEVIANKGCAFAEYTSIESARQAIAASHSQSHGGGILAEVGQGSPPVKIFIEAKKERGDRPPSRPRGGAPVNGEGGGRGRHQGGGAYRGGMRRGAPPPAGK